MTNDKTRAYHLFSFVNVINYIAAICAVENNHKDESILQDIAKTLRGMVEDSLYRGIPVPKILHIEGSQALSPKYYSIIKEFVRANRIKSPSQNDFSYLDFLIHMNPDIQLGFEQYQQQAKATAVYPDGALFIYHSEGDCTITTPGGQVVRGFIADFSLGEIYCMLKLAGETGELLEKAGKIIRDKMGRVSEDDKALMIKEKGDVLWYLAQLSTERATSFGYVADVNLRKLAKRKYTGKLNGSGDTREEDAPDGKS